MKKILKKIVVTLMVAMTIFTFSGRYYVHALEAPEPPEAPSAPSAPDSPEVPDVSTIPDAPDAPPHPEYEGEAPDAPEAPEVPAAPTPPPQPNLDGDDEQQLASEGTSVESGTGGEAGDGNVGDTQISTGDAENTGTIINTGNTNSATTGSEDDGGSSSTISGNGAGSDNSSSASTTSESETNQDNSAQIENDMSMATVTGDNSTSFNVGDSSITTGDVNTTGTVVTSVNTNLDGVALVEFNVVDDHVGDIVLDPASACETGCSVDSTSSEISENGAESTNESDTTSSSSDATNQANDAEVVSNIDLVSDSGSNDANFNTGGDSSISTGDANVEANVLTFLNNNFAGDVVLGVVNIFGNLVGDIILSEEALAALCGSCVNGSDTKISGNGEGSTNTADSTNSQNTEVDQFNNADIENNLVLDANTGDNDSSFNTGGTSSVETGSAEVDVNVLNIANLNLIGGDFWLVIVNEAGKWIGKIIGADGNYLASDGIELAVDETGDVYVTGNGAGSDNSASSTNTTDTTINQTNNAKVVNNVNLTANTGGNSASYNTDGNSDIVTGDATVIANIVNFVNNNIVGTGNLFVTVVNVFGSWLGDFVGPGMEKENGPAGAGLAVGGSADSGQTSSGESSSGDDVESTSNAGSQKGVVAGVTTAGNGPISPSSIKALTAGIVDNVFADNESDDSGDGIASTTAGDQVVFVNLSWLILLIPLALFVFVVRRKKLVYKLLPLNKGK